MLTDMIKRKNDYPHINLFLLLLFCGYVITWYLQLGERRTELGEIRFEFIYAASLFSISIFLLKRSNLSCPLIPYLLLFFIVSLIQLPFSYDLQTSWLLFVERMFKFAFLGYFIIIFVRSPLALKLFFGAFFIAFLKMGQEGIWGKISGNMLWENQGVMRLHGTTSLYAHPNSYSGSAIGTLPFIYYLFPISSIAVRILFILQFLFALNIIIYTGSRTGYVAFLLGICYLILKSANKIRNFAILAVVSISLFYYFPNPYFERFETIFTLQEKEGQSAIKRIQIVKDSVQILKEHPFGVGIGAFPAVRKEMFGREQDTHNLYLQVAADLGIQGFIIFFLMIFKGLKLLKILGADISEQITLMRNKLSKDYFPTEVSARAEMHIKDLNLMALTCSAVYLFVLLRLALGIFGHDLYEIYWWFALGLTISIYNINKYSKPKTEEFLQYQPHQKEEEPTSEFLAKGGDAIR